MVDQFYGGKDDTLVCDLLRAQTPPPKWIVYRVLHYTPHTYNAIGTIGHTATTCAHCPLPRSKHIGGPHDLRVLLLLVNGPLRHLTWKTDKDDELPKAVRNWLHTLFNIAEAASVRLDGWAAYDGRSQE
jgi:hypothetical protein